MEDAKEVYSILIILSRVESDELAALRFVRDEVISCTRALVNLYLTTRKFEG